MATLNKANRKNVKSLIPLTLLFMITLMSIGYASINSITMNISGNVNTKSQEGIFITDVKVLEGNGNINSYSSTILGTNTTLIDDVSSQVTYEVKFYNSTDNDVPYFGEIFDKEDNSLFYTNPNIKYEVNIKKGDVILKHDYLTLTITFKYKNGVVSENKNLESFINFIFINDEYLFDYKGFVQEFDVPINGTYKLEVWGAQGGSYSSDVYGGYGGYSVGNISLKKNDVLNVVVGGMGSGGNPFSVFNGGYNGGGSTIISSDAPGNRFISSGGGATHIAIETNEYDGTESGELASLINEDGSIKLNALLIVAGGGGGSYYHLTSRNYIAIGGSGGGFEGANGQHNPGYGNGEGTGGTQTKAGHALTSTEIGNGYFGLGGNVENTAAHGSAGGGGFYGGGASVAGTIQEDLVGNSSGGGGSGYLNPILSNKIMYCYNCKESLNESDETNIKTRITTFADIDPISNHAKKENGFAKITLISID